MKITGIKREHRSFTGKEGDRVELDMAIITCDDGGTYEVWKNSDKINVGDEITGRIDKRPGKLDKINLVSVNTNSLVPPSQGNSRPSGGGGWRPSGGSAKPSDADRSKSFAAAYAKDIVVALINKDQVNMAAVDEVFEHYFGMFMGKLS